MLQRRWKSSYAPINRNIVNISSPFPNIVCSHQSLSRCSAIESSKLKPWNSLTERRHRWPSCVVCIWCDNGACNLAWNALQERTKNQRSGRNVFWRCVALPWRQYHANPLLLFWTWLFINLVHLRSSRVATRKGWPHLGRYRWQSLSWKRSHIGSSFCPCRVSLARNDPITDNSGHWLSKKWKGAILRLERFVHAHNLILHSTRSLMSFQRLNRMNPQRCMRQPLRGGKYGYNCGCTSKVCPIFLISLYPSDCLHECIRTVLSLQLHMYLVTLSCCSSLCHTDLWTGCWGSCK